VLLIQIIVGVISILLIVNIILTFNTIKNKFGNKRDENENQVSFLTQSLKDTESNLKSEFTTNRKENSDNAKGLREEVGRNEKHC